MLLPSIQAPPLELPILYHSSRKEDISIESCRGHYHGVSTQTQIARIIY
jgi:hypothetical protein